MGKSSKKKNQPNIETSISGESSHADNQSCTIINQLDKSLSSNAQVPLDSSKSEDLEAQNVTDTINDTTTSNNKAPKVAKATKATKVPKVAKAPKVAKVPKVAKAPKVVDSSLPEVLDTSDLPESNDTGDNLDISEDQNGVIDKKKSKKTTSRNKKKIPNILHLPIRSSLLYQEGGINAPQPYDLNNPNVSFTTNVAHSKTSNEIDSGNKSIMVPGEESEKEISKHKNLFKI